MILRFLMNLEPVHKATTREERESIYRFRYQVYVKELKYPYPDADHERGWLKQEEDDKDYTTLFYTGRAAEVTSSVRIRAWEPGQVPPALFEAMSLGLFPGIEKLRVAHVGRLMIRRTLRGQMLFPSLLRGGYEFLAGEARCDLGFLDCVPGIVRHYRQLGAIPYGGRLLDLGYSPGIPLLLPISDYAHLKRHGSPVAPLVKKYFGPGKREPLDMSPYRHLIDEGAAPVEFDAARVWDEFEERLLSDERTPSFVDALPEKAMKHLASSGYLLKVAAGDFVTREGTGEREMFVILDGAFEVVGGGRRLALLEKGDLFGEVAFFTEAGERTASVRAASEGRLLVLRRKFLAELTKSDPEAGFQILMNMSRILAERMAGMVRAAAAAREGD